MDNSMLIDMVVDNLAEGKEKSSKMKMSELKKKIRQEILAELTLNEDNEVDLNISDPDKEYDPLDEATKDKDGKVPSKDANTDIDIEDKVDIDVEEKPKAAGPSGDFLDQLEDLKDEADAIGDNKLERQVDNTITYFTRQHIAKDTNESFELEEALTNDDLIYNRMLDIDQEQLVSSILSFAENNPLITLEDYLNNKFGYNDELEEAYNTVKQLKSVINEVNLLNAKLLYTNKLFRNFDLNDTQKMKVIENFDRAANTREAKLVFATLAESFNKPKLTPKRKMVKESIASKHVATTAPSKETTQILSEGFEMANRWKKLAGLI
jgi:hypothetical protein